MNRLSIYYISFFGASLILYSNLFGSAVYYKQNFSSLSSRYKALSSNYYSNYTGTLFDDWAVLFRSWSNNSKRIIAYPHDTGEVFENSIIKWFCNTEGSVEERLRSGGFEKIDDPMFASWYGFAQGRLSNGKLNRSIGKLMLKAIVDYARLFKGRNFIDCAVFGGSFDIIIMYDDVNSMRVYCMPNFSYQFIMKKIIMPLLEEHTFSPLAFMALLWFINKAIFSGGFSFDNRRICDADPEEEELCNEIINIFEAYRNKTNNFLLESRGFCTENIDLCSAIYGKFIAQLCPDESLTCFYHALDVLVRCGW